MQREALLQCGTKELCICPLVTLQNEKFPSALKNLYCGFWQQHILKLQFHCSTIIYVHIWILCMNQKIHPPFLVCSFPSLPDLPLSLQVCLSALSCCCFQTAKETKKSVPGCSTKPYSSYLWIDFQHIVRTAIFPLFPLFRS